MTARYSTLVIDACGHPPEPLRVVLVSRPVTRVERSLSHESRTDRVLDTRVPQCNTWVKEPPVRTMSPHACNGSQCHRAVHLPPNGGWSVHHLAERAEWRSNATGPNSEMTSVRRECRHARLSLRSFKWFTAVLHVLTPVVRVLTRPQACNVPLCALPFCCAERSPSVELGRRLPETYEGGEL